MGRLLILSGFVALVIAAAWARWMRAPTWASILVASPALVVGGLTLALGNSLIPLLSALVAFPIALVGMIGVLVLSRPKN